MSNDEHDEDEQMIPKYIWAAPSMEYGWEDGQAYVDPEPRNPNHVRFVNLDSHTQIVKDLLREKEEILKKIQNLTGDIFDALI